MSKLNDADADAFFRQGDEGTYTGGPSDSIPAGVVDVLDDFEEEAPRLSLEQIERRNRYTRWVTGLVGGLAVSALFGVVARAAVTREPEAPRPATASTAPAPAPVAPPAVTVNTLPVVAAAAPLPEPVTVPVNDAPPKPKAPARAKEITPRSAPREPRTTTPALSSRVVPLVPGPTIAVPAVHSSPPTANFPD